MAAGVVVAVAVAASAEALVTDSVLGRKAEEGRAIEIAW